MNYTIQPSQTESFLCCYCARLPLMLSSLLPCLSISFLGAIMPEHFTDMYLPFKDTAKLVWKYSSFFDSLIQSQRMHDKKNLITLYQN